MLGFGGACICFRSAFALSVLRGGSEHLFGRVGMIMMSVHNGRINLSSSMCTLRFATMMIS